MSPIVRVIAFVAQEMHDMRRQPMLLTLLILGPFLILLIFGLGYTGNQAEVNLVVVVPPGSSLSAGLEGLLSRVGPDINTVVRSDETEARRQLARGQIDMVATVPATPQRLLMSGKQVDVHVYINTISPYRRSYLDFLANQLVTIVNQYLQRQLATEILNQAGNPDPITPDIVAQPVVQTTVNTARFQVTYMEFYAPAVVTLLLQHIAVTFAALSLVRDRELGTNELFQSTPLRPVEALLGKFLSYLLITLVIGVLLQVAIVYLLHVPLAGNLWLLLAAGVLEISASLGWGFLISTASARQSQAVQLSMIVLLTSVFFSGFFLPLPGLLPSVRVVSYAMPVTYAIMGFQEIMLAGRSPVLWLYASLGGMTVVAMIIALLLYRRRFRLG